MTTVTLHTSVGSIEIRLEVDRAPISAANFIAYVQKGLFDGGSFYRAHEKFVDGQRRALVQGGVLDFDDLEASQARQLPAIVHEGPGDTGLGNVQGSIAYGRLEPGTAQSEFFINLEDAPEYDFQDDPTAPYDGLGYAVFGRVTEGLQVLEAILKLEKRPSPDIPVMDGQLLKDPVKILSAIVSQEPTSHGS